MNNYSEFKVRLDDFKMKNESEMNKYLETVEIHLNQIEMDFSKKIKNIKTIRTNRFLDKIMWTKGKGR